MRLERPQRSSPALAWGDSEIAVLRAFTLA